jgi:hypothetical protein
MTTGCRTKPRPGAAGSELKGVGFELPGNALIGRGAIVTRPAGREEAFLAYVAGKAPEWVASCQGQEGSTLPVFVFQTDDRGVPAAAFPEATASARERCLGARAAANPTAGTLPPGTGVTVQLALK